MENIKIISIQNQKKLSAYKMSITHIDPARKALEHWIPHRIYLTLRILGQYCDLVARLYSQQALAEHIFRTFSHH